MEKEREKKGGNTAEDSWSLCFSFSGGGGREQSLLCFLTCLKIEGKTESRGRNKFCFIMEGIRFLRDLQMLG